MAKCQICDKSARSGNNVSHSKRATKTKWLPNVHRRNVLIGREIKKVNICTRCLRTRDKVAARG